MSLHVLSIVNISIYSRLSQPFPTSVACLDHIILGSDPKNKKACNDIRVITWESLQQVLKGELPIKEVTRTSTTKSPPKKRSRKDAPPLPLKGKSFLFDGIVSNSSIIEKWIGENGGRVQKKLSQGHSEFT